MIPMVGKRFGRLTVLELAEWKSFGSTPKSYPVWKCRCDCGGEAHIIGQSLRSGKSTSCGCRQREAARAQAKHGQAMREATTPAYNTWLAMKDRCRNPNNENFRHYGGRGIRVCAEWMVFEAFFRDMGERPKGHSIERVDVNGNYEPGNCIWIPRLEQARNTRACRWLECDGVRLLEREWAKLMGIHETTIIYHLKRGTPFPELVARFKARNPGIQDYLDKVRRRIA